MGSGEESIPLAVRMILRKPVTKFYNAMLARAAKPR